MRVGAEPARVGAMKTWLVECYWPDVTQQAHAAAADRARAAVEQLRADGHAVRFLDSVLMPTDEVVFYRFEASSPDAVEQARRWPAGRVMPGSGTWVRPPESSSPLRAQLVCCEPGLFGQHLRRRQ